VLKLISSERKQADAEMPHLHPESLLAAAGDL
jgi:hypothetical protein